MKRLIKSFLKTIGYRIVKEAIPKVIIESPKLTKYTVVSPIVHNTKENMNEFFSNDDQLEKYVSGRQIFYQNLANEIVSLATDKKTGIRICDVGCGPGDLINILGNKIESAKLTGFDHSKKLIEIGQSRFPHIKFKLFNIFQDSTLFKEQFDLVVCSEVVEHLIESKKAILNLLDLVEKDGMLVLTVPEGRKDNYLGHINFWSPESWSQFIKDIAMESGVKSYTINLLKIEGTEYNMATFLKNDKK